MRRPYRPDWCVWKKSASTSYWSILGRSAEDLIGHPLGIPIAEAHGAELDIMHGPDSVRTVDVRVEQELPTLMADKTQVGRVFMNLIENALRYGTGNRYPVLEIRAERTDDEVRICVRDNGDGIPEAYQEKIFQLFGRVDTTHRGTGVGLAIVKRIVEAHGGRVWVESKPGAGAAFWLAFPPDRDLAVRKGEETDVRDDCETSALSVG